jgi:peptide/nickel transport system permease protein
LNNATAEVSPATRTAPREGARRRWAVAPPGVLIAAAAVLLLVLVAAMPGTFTSASPTATNLAAALHAPGTAHWLGTDELGRDQLVRLVYGTRPSLLLGAGSTVIAVIAGTILGLAAALGGQVADNVLMRLVDVLLALPPILLSLLIIAVLGTGTMNLVIAVAVASVPGYARLVRSEAQVVRRSAYVEAAVSLGLRRPVLILRHVLPNSLAPLLTLATVGFGTALTSASGLSFLGLGPQPPSPEWGAMLSSGRDFLSTAWWLGVFPGAAVTITVIAVTVIGHYLQRRFVRRSI